MTFEPKAVNHRITKIAHALKVERSDKKTEGGLSLVGKDGESYSMALIIMALAERILKV